MGRSGIRRISRFDASKYATQFAGEVSDFDPKDYLERRMIVQTDRWTWMGLAATEMALSDAALDPTAQDPMSMSVVTASSSGGNEFGQREIGRLWGRGARFVGAYQSIAWFYAATTGQISIRHGMKGPSGVVVAEQAGGLEALAHARRTIRRGVETVVSGGLEAPLSPYALTCQLANGEMSSVADASAYRPFDASATGYFPGEGGAVLVVENLEHAERRGAEQIYGEILGYGATNDAAHPTRRSRDARQLARAMSVALSNAGVTPDDVDAVFADGAGIPAADHVELEAIQHVFGDRARELPVTAPKAGVGRLYSGGAALDVAAALLAIRDDVVPPTINLDHPCMNGAVRLVTSATEKRLRTILVNARGFGGFNASLVVRSAAESTTPKEV